MEQFDLVALTSILVATDATLGGRHAVRIGAALANRSGADLLVMTVKPPDENGSGRSAGQLLTSRSERDRPSADLADFFDWLGPDSPNGSEVAVAFGVPGIEIVRVAQQRSANLIVIGRRPRAPQHPLRLGDTADALVRRSDTPVLSVPPQIERFGSALIAIDGSKRSAVILERGMALIGALDIEAIRVVTVETAPDDERSASGQPTGRTLRLERSLEQYRAVASQGSSVALTVRRGAVVDEVLSEVEERHPDMLVIGYRRGGPARLVAPSEIARNLLYSSPTAVLTVPL